MAIHTVVPTTSKSIFLSLTFLILLSFPHSYSSEVIPQSDKELGEVAFNFIMLEAQILCYGSLGRGLESLAPQYTGGGPSPIGAQKALLDPPTQDIFTQFCYQDIGHLRALQGILEEPFRTPLLNYSKGVFATYMDNAFERTLYPPFDPYANSINYLLGLYLIYVGNSLAVGAGPMLESATFKEFLARLVGVDAGQEAIIRGLLYPVRCKLVLSYNITVAEFTDRISEYRNKLGKAGLKDEGLVVPRFLGAEGKVEGNIIAGNENSTFYARTLQEVLRIVYGTGNESVPGGFFPHGLNGRLPRSFLGPGN